MVGGILVLWVVSIALIHGYLVGRVILPTYPRYAARDSKRALSALSMSSVVEDVEHTVDVAVIGGGPAGTTIAWLLQEREQCRVAIIDPNGNSEGTWYPNYGEWRDEWEALCRRLELPELRDCTTTEWEVTDTFFGGSFDLPEDDKLVLDRAYVRVDRKKMQRLIKDRFRRANGLVIESKLVSQLVAPNIFDDHLVHDSRGSTLTLLDGSRVRSKLVIDATG